MEALSSNFILFFLMFINKVVSLCHLPNQWTGMWYQSSGIDLLNISESNFLNRGICIENRQDKFLFFEKNECYRCIFIMQKHSNVLQYRTSYCSEKRDFEFNCQNLTPESELFTIYRDNSLSENCQLNGLYTIHNSHNEKTNIQNFPKRCDDRDSSIMECSDQSILKLHFGKCVNMPDFIFNCIAHWIEGNTNYLIGKLQNDNQKPIYKCLAYIDLTRSSQARVFRNENFINLNKKKRNDGTKHTIQMLISQDEFCRNIDNIIDDQLSFRFNKVYDFRHQININTVRKQSSLIKDKNYKQLSSNFNGNCKFPRWFNKKWHDLKQTKSFALNYKLDTLIINDVKKSITINKCSCWHVKSRKPNHFQAVVNSLNGCTRGFQCLEIIIKSNYVLEIKFGKVSYVNHMLNCSNENYVTQDFVYVDTNYGVKCPFKSGIYTQIVSKSSDLRSETSIQESCKILTQTQILQTGCQSSEQYSLRTNLCYPNNQEKRGDNFSASKNTTISYTQLESEINLSCLAYWNQDGKNVVISRTMSNEILCSIWSFSRDASILKLLEIDSTCNYKEAYSRVNYEFLFVDSCQTEMSQFKSYIRSYRKNSTSSRTYRKLKF